MEKEIVIPKARDVFLATDGKDYANIGENQVAGHTLVSLISTGTEINLAYLGTFANPNSRQNYPLRPGYSAVFEVEETGACVRNVKKGDRMLCTGPHKSYQVQHQDEVVKLPEGLLPEVAAFARLMVVTMTTLDTTMARPGNRVLFMGLGPIGMMGAKVFARCGYDVLCVDPDAGRCRTARNSGLASVCGKAPVDDPAWFEQIALAVDCSGVEPAALDACKMAREGAEVVLVGVPWRKTSDLCAYEITRQVFFKYLQLRSGFEWRIPRKKTKFDGSSHFDNLRIAMQWLSEGSVSVDGLYHSVSPGDVKQVYDDLLNRKAPNLVTLFDWRTP